MPYDPHSDDDGDGGSAEPRRRFREFDCPVCAANNPCGEPFHEGDEIHCFYCGQGFLAVVVDGWLRLKES